MSKQLFSRDLRAGDILLQLPSVTAGLSHRLGYAAITFGQKLTGKPNPDVIHAGIMFDSTFMIESDGAGIGANDMRIQNKQFGYIAFRCRNTVIAQGAGTCAKVMFDIHKQGKGMGYDAIGAVKSIFGGPGKAKSRSDMDALLDRILAGRTHRFFCSQLVAFVYQFVAEQNGIPGTSLFNLSDAKVPPATLAALLSRHPLFDEVGYLMANER